MCLGLSLSSGRNKMWGPTVYKERRNCQNLSKSLKMSLKSSKIKVKMTSRTQLLKHRIREREQASFDSRELTYFLDGGPEETAKLEKMMLQIERDPVFKSPSLQLSLKEHRELCFKRMAKVLPYLIEEDEKTFVQRMYLLPIVDGAVNTRLGVHIGLFLQTVRALGTSEQFQHWLVDKGAGNVSKFFGCFGMTELTHGSNVSNLQTTATFDESIDGFVVHTPHLGATKWWIGGAAHSATHCVVYARLISKGKDYGVKNFVVQLRDVNSHQLLPGISIGDIGKKMGRDGVDNGWIQFSNVRIPRFNMLSKFTQIDEEGNVTLPKFEQLGYTALVNGRVSMVNDSYNVGKKFITIALRYATVRRQFGKDDEGLEKKLIDYPHHRRRLFPLLATIFAFNSSSLEVTNFNYKTQEIVSKGDVKAAIPNMKDLFALSAGMKAFATWEVCKLIEEARQSCGGHGYSAHNLFGPFYNDWVVQCTWEGDNNVLSLSCGRALIQNYLSLINGGDVGEYSKYLKDDGLDSVVLNVQDLDDLDSLVKAWESVSKKTIMKGATKFKSFDDRLNNLEQSFEKISSNRFEIAKIHTKLTTLKTFVARIKQDAKPGLKPVLTLLAKLYALHITIENIAHFYSFQIITGSEIYESINYKIDEVNEKLRPDIIALTDAFNLSDFFIGAPIGKYDGDIYDSYFQKVNESSGYETKPEYYDTVMKPFFDRDLTPNDNQEYDE